MSRTLELTTPEGVPLRFDVADPISRGGAFILDVVLVVLVSVPVIVLFAVWLTTGILVDGGVALLIICVFFLRHGYFAFFELLWHGETPGKRVLGLRVVSRDGGSLEPPAVLARNLLRDVELFVPLLLLLNPGALTLTGSWILGLAAASWALAVGMLPLLTREHRRMGDLLADTVVVVVPRSELLLDEARRSTRRDLQAREPTFSDEQLAIYGEHELETLAEILRQADLRADPSELALVARTIARKTGYAGNEPQQEPLRFLRAFYRAQRAALEKKLLLGKRKADKFDRA